MLIFRHHESFSFLTTSAIGLTLCGLGLTFIGGIMLAAYGCVLHAIQNHQAWRVESALLVIFMVVLLAEPLLPTAVQDTLIYLMP
jgi:hypothetical protein